MWVRCWSLLNKSGVGPRPQRPWFHGGCGFCGPPRMSSSVNDAILGPRSVQDTMLVTGKPVRYKSTHKSSFPHRGGERRGTD